MLDLTIIIVNYNTKKLTLSCINSIKKSKPNISYQIVIVDNGSKEDIQKELKRNYPGIKFISSAKNLGFAGGNNIALGKTEGDSHFYLLLNSDTKVTNGALDSLVAFAKKSNSGISSCRLINPDGSFQPNAGRLPNLLPVFFWLSGLDDILRFIIKLPSYQERDASYYKGDIEVGWISGSVMLIDKSVINKTGLMDDQIFMYGEDVDYCFRAKNDGFYVGWTNNAEIMHIGGASSPKARYSQWLGEFQGLLYLYKKHFNVISVLILKLLMYIFIFIRIIAFYVVGKPDYAKTYAKILKDL